MKAAIYARKSNEQSGVSDEQKSVARQIEHGKAYATKKGWIVSDELIFIDDGISGVEFVKRPGFIHLMNSLRPNPSFQILIMSEESRLGRESIETSYALKQIIDAGVRLFFYLEDRERTLDNAMDKMMLSLTNFASEMERERAKQRTYDTMLRKAKAKQVTGGKTFGYDNREVLSEDKRRLFVHRVINQQEADTVRQIFTMYAGGLGITRIAKRLNDEGIPAPRQSPRGWAPTAVREILYRPLYRGEIVYGQLQKIVRGGTKKRRERDEKDWIRVDAPELRIVTQEIWNTVHTRLAKVKAGGKSFFRDQESKYLLTGMARCGSCGGPIEAIGRDYSRKKGRYYGCAYHRKRGTAICSISLRVEQDVVDQVVLKAITDVLDQRLLEAAVEGALGILTLGQDERMTRQGAIERELPLIEACERHLVDAITRGDNMEPLLTRLRSEESRKSRLIAELDALKRPAHSVELDRVRLKRDLKSRVADAKTLLGRNTTQARQILQKMIEKPLTFHVIEKDGKKGYRLMGQGSYFQLMPGQLASPCVVSHLIANWNPLLNWLGDVNLLKETLPIKALDGQNRYFQANFAAHS